MSDTNNASSPADEQVRIPVTRVPNAEGGATYVPTEDYLSSLVRASVWSVPPVAVEPNITLEQWRIKYTPKGCFFVGREVGSAGRVSTNIVEFDRVLMIGKTASGRTYKLEGPSGYNRDAEWVWGACVRNRGEYDPEIGDEYSIEALVTILESAKEVTAAANAADAQAAASGNEVA